MGELVLATWSTPAIADTAAELATGVLLVELELRGQRPTIVAAAVFAGTLPCCLAASAQRSNRLP